MPGLMLRMSSGELRAGDMRTSRTGNIDNKDILVKLTD